MMWREVVGQAHTEEDCLVQDLLKTALNAAKGNFLNDNACLHFSGTSAMHLSAPPVQGLEIFRWVEDQDGADNNGPQQPRTMANGSWRRWLVLCWAIQRACKISSLLKIKYKVELKACSAYPCSWAGENEEIFHMKLSFPCLFFRGNWVRIVQH